MILLEICKSDQKEEEEPLKYIWLAQKEKNGRMKGQKDEDLGTGRGKVHRLTKVEIQNFTKVIYTTNDKRAPLALPPLLYNC